MTKLSLPPMNQMGYWLVDSPWNGLGMLTYDLWRELVYISLPGRSYLGRTYLNNQLTSAIERINERHPLFHTQLEGKQ